MAFFCLSSRRPKTARMKLAIIDMGTNTFHLLIAHGSEAGYCIVYRERLAVKIGKGGINRGIITEDGLHRALVAMQSFKNKIDEQQAERVFAFGTSALRNAANSAEVISRIHALTGIEVHVISGDQEAEFICRGVRSALRIGQEKALIVDIGGGSVEFIISNDDTIFWKQSIEIGAQRLLETFHQNDPISALEIKALDAHFEEQLKPVLDQLRVWQPHVLIGSSGTFDTLSDIFCLQHHISKSDDDSETPLTIPGFYEIYHELITRNRGERMQMPGMIEMRVDMIVVACCLIRFILEKHAFNWVRVSTYALKEGVLAWLKDSAAAPKEIH
jgi:exopolyphosphatase/guanosine-5'-triphosphate,3'-diphosphate pyrophosphatase